MYIKSVAITNFKCFLNKKIELDPNFNLIVGENNSGKSTFFEALRLWQLAMQQFYTARTRKQVHNVGFRKKSSYEALDVSDLTFLRIQDVKEVFLNKNNDFVIEICFSNGVDEANVSVSFKPTSRNTLNCKLQSDRTITSDNLFKVMKIANNNTFRNRIRLAYIPPKFTIPVKEVLLSENNEVIRDSLILGKSQTVIRNILHHWCELNYRKATKQSDIKNIKSNLDKVITVKSFTNNYTKNIKPYIEKILQEKVISNKNEKHKRLEAIEKGLNKIINQEFDFKSYNDPTEDYNLAIKNHNDNTEISQLGSGTINVLNILTVLEYNNQTLDKAATKCNLLLLDEPDSHLHSNLQKELFNHLDEKSKDNNTQIFIITHNTSLISQFESVVFFDTKSNIVSPIPISDYLENHLRDMDINQYNVIKQLNKAKLETQQLQQQILESNKTLILFEGSTDRRIFRTAFKKLYNQDFPFETNDKISNASQITTAFNSHNNPNGFLIGIFDNDETGKKQFNNIDNAFKKNTDIFKTKENALAILLPVPEDRKLPFYQRHLTVEYLFSNENLESMGIKLIKDEGENYKKIQPKDPEQERYSIKDCDKTKISKNCNNLESSAFENFKPIFEKIFDFTGFNPHT